METTPDLEERPSRWQRWFAAAVIAAAVAGLGVVAAGAVGDVRQHSEKPCPNPFEYPRLAQLCELKHQGYDVDY